MSMLAKGGGAALVGWLALGIGTHAAEKPAERVTVGLFKNGLAVVRREIDITSADGAYRIEEIPAAIHGTFHIEGDVPFRARIETGEVARTVGALSNFRDLALLEGREVTLSLRDRQPSTVAGVILPSTPDAAAAPDIIARYGYYYGGWAPPAPPSQPGLIALRAGEETMYIDPAAVVSASVKGGGGPMRRMERRPVMVIAPEKGGPVRHCALNYITQGAAWAPDYQVDLLDKRRLRIAQDAVIRTETLALDGAEVFLITGYPNIEFGHVRSPLSPDVTWASFLAQSGRDPQSDPLYTRNVISQQVVFNNGAADNSAAGLPAAPTGEGPDIHWQPAGRLTMGNNESMALRVASAEADYEQIVTWEVPDRRDERGRYANDAGARDKVAESPWDAVRFANPFAFPMTTAPVLVSEKDHVLGQSISYWTRPGERTLVRVNKALSVRVHQEETEEEGDRPMVWVAGNDYQKCAVKASLSVSNGRKERLRFLLSRKLSGEVLSAEGAPSDRLLEEGIWSVNARHELSWEFELAPGEARQIVVRYSVLVDR